MRFVTLALILASTGLSPALAAPDGRFGRSAERVEAPATSPAPMQVADRGGHGGGWQGRSGGNGGGGWQGGGGRQDGGWRSSGSAQPQASGGWQGRSGGNDGGGWRQRSAPSVSTPVPQASQPVQRNWNGGGNRWQGRQDRVVTPAPGGTFDRNANGRVDRNWDRNRNGVVDRQWDRNRDGQLDRRWDRNGNGNLDRRWDRNNDNRPDHNWNRNHNGRDSRYGYDRGRGGNDWNRGWRNDRRYDWYSYRNYNRDYYRMSRYVNPYGYGYGYQRFGIGFYLDSLFYSSAYWINDPWSYRLPSAYDGYRWVRYYDDVLLIDMRSGYVVDVIHDFFW